MGNLLIEYAFDACRYSQSVDDIVIVTSGEYLDIDTWLSSYGNSEEVGGWLRNIPRDVQELADKWKLERWEMDPQTFATCVFEAHSRKFGDVVLKLHSPTGRYTAELWPN